MPEMKIVFSEEPFGGKNFFYFGRIATESGDWCLSCFRFHCKYLKFGLYLSNLHLKCFGIQLDCCNGTMMLQCKFLWFNWWIFWPTLWTVRNRLGIP